MVTTLASGAKTGAILICMIGIPPTGGPQKGMRQPEPVAMNMKGGAARKLCVQMFRARCRPSLLHIGLFFLGGVQSQSQGFADENYATPMENSTASASGNTGASDGKKDG